MSYEPIGTLHRRRRRPPAETRHAGRPTSASSASATSACRWPSNWRAPGFKTTGIDLDARKVDAINRGESYIPDVPTARRRRVPPGRTGCSPRPTPAVVATLDTINICVPTPLRKTKDPDLSYVVSAVEMIAEHLHPGQLVILESTTYPGTTDEVVRPILERGGLVAGRDFFLAFSPERVDPGNETWTTRNVPKVVGGTDADLHGAGARALLGVDRARSSKSARRKSRRW